MFYSAILINALIVGPVRALNAINPEAVQDVLAGRPHSPYTDRSRLPDRRLFR